MGNYSKARGSRRNESTGITPQRIYDMRLEKRERQEETAAAIFRSVSQYARYEKGQSAVPPDSIKALAEHWNIPPEYLEGKTDTKDKYKFYLECEEAADEAGEDEQKAVRAQRERLKCLFEECGYTIDILVGTAKYDFSDSPIAAYTLKDKHGKFPTAELNEEDLPVIIAGLHEAVAYECFKAINKRGHENGNS